MNGGARGGGSKGEGRGGGNGGQSVRTRGLGAGSLVPGCRRRGARRRSVHDRRAGSMSCRRRFPECQRPCRGVRCEHKLTAAVSPMALASEAPRHGSVVRVASLSRMQSGARAGASRHARPTVPSKTIVALGACKVERTGPCGRSERKPGGAHARARARAQVQGPGRGDRGTDRGAVSRALPRWSGPPVRSQREGML